MEPLLLVEDKPELRAMLKKALERAGHTVDEARTAPPPWPKFARAATCSS